MPTFCTLPENNSECQNIQSRVALAEMKVSTLSTTEMGSETSEITNYGRSELPLERDKFCVSPTPGFSE